MKKAPAHIVGVDFGNSSMKAVHLQKQGDQYALTRVALSPNIRDMSATTGSGTALPTEHNVSQQLKEVLALAKGAGSEVHFSVNSPNSTIRYIDMPPQMPLDEFRSSLKFNSETFLRQKFENYTFDACAMDEEGNEALAARKNKKAAAASHGKIKIIVSGISSPEVILYYHASRRAGIKPRSLQLAPVALMNGFEAAYPEVFRENAVALLDLGFLSSSLTILDKGKPLLTRVVPVGGKQITEYIGQMNNMDFTKAEAAKLQGDSTLGEAVARVAVSLIREVKSSINFFEKNSDQTISKVYLTGASAVSSAVAEALTKDIERTCEAWSAARGLTIQLPPEQQGLFTQNEFAFSSALGVARTYAIKETAPAPKAAAPVVEAKPSNPALSRSTIQPPS